MAKTREQKEQIVADLSRKLTDMKSAVIADYQGLTVHESEELRAKLREQGTELVAIRKTLLKRAMQDAGLEGDVESLEGSLSVAVGTEDEVAPAKVLAEFAKGHENLTILAGMLDGAMLDQAAVQNLATIPSRPELLAKAVGSIKSPITGFVNVLAGNMRGLVNVLNAYKDARA